MKKLITAAVASAFAFLAMGAANAVELPSGTSLENLTAGEALDPTKNDSGTGSDSTYWFLAGDESAELLVSNYVAASYQPRPEQFTGDNNNYLKIDTNGRLYRSVGVNSQTLDSFPTAEIGDGIYLDTLVQFTAADDEFKEDAIATGDKIAIEYVEREEERDGDDNITVTAMTNFVVRAAYVDAANSRIVATNYYLTFPGQAANAVQFDKTAWHRLTVRAISNVGNAYAPVGFVVYVDGTNLVYDASVAAGDEAYVGSLNSVVKTYLYNSETHSLLPSLMTTDDNGYDALSAVAFNGNGCVDDISFTATKPGILPSEGMTVTIAWDDNVASYTVVAGETTLVDGEVVSGEGSTNLLLSAGITAITVTATYAEGYEAGVWSKSAGTLNNGVWTFENGAMLTINSMLPLFQVGETHYGTFAKALEAAVAAGTEVSPATIKLLADISEGISFASGYIVLDLNGKTLQGGEQDGYTINNNGATLTIIDSAPGGGGTVKQPTGEAAEGAFYTDNGTTTINAGTFESTVYTEKMQDPEAPGEIVVNGGVFADPDYNPTDPDSKFYLYDYLADGVKATYDAGYFTVGEPIIGTYTVTVTPTDNATYAVTGAASNDGDVYAVATAHTITITATPKSGYEYAEVPTGWTAGQNGEITIEVSEAGTVAIPAPTAKQIIGTYEVVVTPNANATYAAICTNDDSAVVFNENITTVRVGYAIMITATPNENYEYATTPDGWTAGENGVITKVVDVAGTVAIPAPTATGSSYPTYIDGIEDATAKAAYEAKYDTWKTTYGADTSSEHEAAFLLNIAQDATDQTLEPVSITMEGGKVVISANQTLTTVNGKVYVKVATTLAGLATAEWTEATLDEGKVQVTPGSSDTAGFYKIKVDF